VKFSFRQIMASAAGAVLAALIASSFGVTGTIIGVAIASCAATIGTALVSQSIERGHEAVKQVAVRVPEGTTSPLLRRLGGTRASGSATSSSGGSSESRDGSPSSADAAPTEVVGPAAQDTTQMESAAGLVEETRRLEISAVADAPATEHLVATTLPAQPPRPLPAAPRGGSTPFSWKAIAATTAAVFALALLLVIAIELIAGKPLFSNVINPSSPTTTTTTTTTTTGPGSTTTTTSPPSSSTTTSPSTTTTTAGASSTTSTTTSNLGGTTTTTPGVGSATSTTVP
jgi:hypothetical protein